MNRQIQTGSQISILLLVILLCGSILFIKGRDTFNPEQNALPILNALNSNSVAMKAAAVEGAGSGLIGWWKFDEGNGTTASDSSGRSNDAGTYGATSVNWSSGKFGNVIGFDGASQYLSVKNPTADSLSFDKSSFTISVWVNTAVAATTQGIVNMGNAPNTTGIGYQLNIVSNNHFYFYLGDGVAGNRFINADPIVAAGQWYHLVVVAEYDGTNWGKSAFYVNGVKSVKGASNLNQVTGSINPPQKNLDIGKRSGNFGYFNGSMDDLRIYNRALSEQEISDIYNSPGYTATAVQVATNISTPSDTNTNTTPANASTAQNNNTPIAPVVANVSPSATNFSAEVSNVVSQYPEINQLLGTAIVVNAADYGVTPGAVDNTSALIKMRNDLVGKGANNFYEIHFPAGLIKYNNSQWLRGLKTGFRLIGPGTQFQNAVVGASWGRDNTPLRLSGLFENTPLDQVGCCIYIPTSRVKTVMAGATSIELTNPVDSKDYKAGDRILLYGFDQQFGGYPPNARYFEHVVISGVDQSSGVISLTKPLQYSYLDTWRDNITSSAGSAQVGKPRIINKDHRLQVGWPHLIYMEGVKFLNNPNSSIGTQSVFEADYVILKDVSFEGIWAPAISELTIGQNSGNVNGDVLEVDKLINKFYYLDGTVPTQFAAATGVNFMRIARSKIKNSFLAPRYLEYEDNTFIIPSSYTTCSPFKQYPRSFPIDQIVFKGFNQVINQSTCTGNHVFYYDRLQPIPASSLGPNGEIYVDDNAVNLEYMSQLGIGYKVQTINGKVGQITAIDYDSAAKRFIIRHTILSLDTTKISFFTVGSMIDNGRITFSPGQTKDWISWLFGEPNWRYPAKSIDSRNVVGTVFIPDSAIKWQRNYWYWPWYAPVARVIVDISKPYSGANSNPLLYLRRTDSNNVGQVFGIINLKVAGRREVTPTGVVGAQTGDDFTGITKMAGWANDFQMVLHQGGGPITGSDAEMSIGTIQVDTDINAASNASATYVPPVVVAAPNVPIIAPINPVVPANTIVVPQTVTVTPNNVPTFPNNVNPFVPSNPAKTSTYPNPAANTNVQAKFTTLKKLTSKSQATGDNTLLSIPTTTIDIAVPKVPSWIEVLVALFKEIVNRIKMGAMKTWVSLVEIAK